MKRQGRGEIVTLASIAGRGPGNDSNSTCAAAKGGATQVASRAFAGVRDGTGRPSPSGRCGVAPGQDPLRAVR